LGRESCCRCSPSPALAAAQLWPLAFHPPRRVHAQLRCGRTAPPALPPAVPAVPVQAFAPPARARPPRRRVRPPSPSPLGPGRATAELWPLTATQATTGYAFDDDPDGAYSDDDREVRKRLEDLPWPDRTAELRLSGVTHVVSDEPLPEPFRELQVLNAAEGVR